MYKINLRGPGAQKGFTLIEILVVIGILGMLAGITIYGVREIRARAARQHTESVIRNLDLAFEKYRQDAGVYPDISNSFQNVYECLENLRLTDPFGAKGKTKGTVAVIKTGANYFVCDYWQNPIQFLIGDSAKSHPGPDIWSMGPDGKTGGSFSADDIANYDLR